MKGSFRIQAQTKEAAYDITIRRNITVITGDSGSGKSLLSIIAERSSVGAYGYSCVATPNVSVVSPSPGEVFRRDMGFYENSIVILDEDVLHRLSFDTISDILHSSSSYWILITRKMEYLERFQFSVHEIYSLYSDNDVLKLRPYYDIPANRLFGYYSGMELSGFISEDSNSCFKFFSKVLGDNPIKVSSCGKGGIVPKIKEFASHTSKLIVFLDASAYGPYMTLLFSTLVMNAYKDCVCIYFMESFEWFLLHSIMFKEDVKIQELLRNPYDFIESREYMTHEQFYTPYLARVCPKYALRYAKKKEPVSFMGEDNVAHLLSLMGLIEAPKKVSKIDINKELTAEDFANMEASLAKLKKPRS